MADAMAEDAVCAAVLPLPDGSIGASETQTLKQLEARMETETDTETGVDRGTGTETAETRLDIEQGKPGLSSDIDGSDDCDDSGTDHDTGDSPGTSLRKAVRPGGSTLPDTFQTNHLLFYERFKAYQDYMLGDCKTSEVKAFVVDYLEKVVEPCDWRALWSTEVFDVLVEVMDVDYGELKARVELVVPLRCEVRGCELGEEAMRDLLEATQHMVPLHELHVVYDESGDFDQTALAVEHLRFFYKHIWRKWDEEDEDDDFDYFVRCVEPRLRLHYDILEDRVPAGLVVEYHSLLGRCAQIFQEFSSLRNDLGTDSDSELDNVSMVEGLRLFEQMEVLKRKLRIIENPLLRETTRVDKFIMHMQFHDCDTQMEGFHKAMAMVGTEFLDRLDFYQNSWLPARSLVETAVRNRTQVDPSGEVVVLEQGGCPWKEHLFSLETELNVQTPIKFVLYQDQNAQWRVQCVPVGLHTFQNRLSLLEKWRGVRDEALSDLSGIPGCVFVHASGFIGGNRTMEGALEMARRTLQAAANSPDEGNKIQANSS